MSEFIIGLTGGIGSGKSAVATEFHHLGIDIIDADIISRDIVLYGKPAHQKIHQHFGSEILQANNELNRAALREKIFKNADDRAWLNALLHPIIRQEMIKQIKLATSPYAILVVPLLIENNLTSLVNRVLVVDCHETTQIRRTMKRDNTNQQTIQNIIAAQTPRKNRLAHADDIIENNDDLADLARKVAEFHSFYLKFA